MTLNGNLLLAGGCLILCLSAGGAEANAGKRHALQPQSAEFRATYFNDEQGSGVMIGRGADRGRSMYFSPQQDESYDGRFP